MALSRRRFVEVGALASIGGFAIGTGTSTASSTDARDDGRANGEVEVTVRQKPDRAFYWVLPGERRLSPQVFGTAENPRRGSTLLESRIEQASGFPEPLDEAVPQLLEDLPFLVAAPEEAREPIEDSDGIAQQKLVEPTLYSDEAAVTSGSFEITYRDRQPYDLRGPPGETDDTVDLETQFTDPAGNEYELDLDHVIQPPIPGYETGGGVRVGAWHHGMTGTGSPLMPQVYDYAACWGVGDVIVNGEVATEEGFRVVHFMTTQTVRDERYRLAIDEEMPLAPGNTIAGQVHHTHGVVLPIRPTPDGPVFDPVPTAMELPNGETQPFIHAMWEQEEIVEGPFAEWEFPTGDEDGAEDTDDEGGDADIRLLGTAQAWEGAAPTSIEGEANPALRLESGVEYVLVWENGDGLQHNLAIEDANGEDVVATDLMGERGATQTVTFTATEEMAEYYCQVHPESMRGSIEISS
ncbi:cupredoxin domain-containing protein [Halomontanus rarus]|uniref:cupredoxin domain-containing protein n=1 Tax=Halomontanus rarus TaxID=3034020 RepID=UPI0023E80876|nr:hypothetical protein [Halovivax sp. TS33]